MRYHSSLVEIAEVMDGEASLLTPQELDNSLTESSTKDISVPELTREQLWEKYLNKKIRKVFMSTEAPPIAFKPKRNSQIDFNINRLVNELNVRVPILHIEKNMYLIGSNRCNCQLKGDKVLVRVGGGYENFEKYVASNHYQFQLILVTHMKNSNLNLDQVAEKLKNGEKLTTNLGTKWNIKRSTLS